LSEVGELAALHGRDLLNLGYTVDQVVHDYGDLCQAITDLAFERDAPFEIDEFRTHRGPRLFDFQRGNQLFQKFWNAVLKLLGRGRPRRALRDLRATSLN